MSPNFVAFVLAFAGISIFMITLGLLFGAAA